MPSVGVLTNQFKSQAEYMAHKSGLTEVPRVFVEHPISDQSSEQLRVKAEAVCEDVVDALENDGFMSRQTPHALDVPTMVECTDDV